MPTVVRKASPADARAICSILDPYADDGIVLRRSVDDVITHIDTFFVIEYKDDVCGVVAYYNYGHHLQEIRSLAVKKTAYHHGLGRLLIEAVIARLVEESPHAKIFTLTLIPDFFRKFGFHEVSMDTLPEKIWKDCSICKKADKCDETALVYGKTTH